MDDCRRSLQWERGLKCFCALLHSLLLLSFPAMGTWIEISEEDAAKVTALPSFPAMGTWIEISSNNFANISYMLSFPAMGTWIEM